METDLNTLTGIIICVLWVISAVYIINKKPGKKKTSEWRSRRHFTLPVPASICISYNHFNSTTNTLGIEVKYEYKNESKLLYYTQK